MTIYDLKPVRRAALLCPAIRQLGGDNGLADAIFQNGDQDLANLIAAGLEAQMYWFQNPTSEMYQRLYRTAAERVLDYLTARCELAVAGQVEDDFAQAHEEPGMTIEQEDNLCRARDMIAGWR